jgi:Glutaminase
MATRRIIGRVEAISPKLDRPPDLFLAAAPAVPMIHFDTAESAGIDPANPRSPTFIEVLDEARRAMLSVYVEVDDATNKITELHIPLVVQVLALVPQANGDLTVELEVSQSEHRLPRGSDRFEEILAILRAALDGGQSVVVAENDRHEILDAKIAPHPTVGRDVLLRAPLAAQLLAPGGTVTPQRAGELFDLVSAQTCDPRSVPPPCIPFLYPDDGCWGRAHQMCRLMISAGAGPGKVWIYGRLTVNTRNNPVCSVRWGWHVAPTLRIATAGPAQTVVVDPSLFSNPVSEDTWKGVQHDPAATVAETDASVFYRSLSGQIVVDADYSQTAQVLATYRLKLKLRSIGPDGAPPYAHCPVAVA